MLNASGNCVQMQGQGYWLPNQGYPCQARQVSFPPLVDLFTGEGGRQAAWTHHPQNQSMAENRNPGIKAFMGKGFTGQPVVHPSWGHTPQPQGPMKVTEKFSELPVLKDPQIQGSPNVQGVSKPQKTMAEEFSEFLSQKESQMQGVSAPERLEMHFPFWEKHAPPEIQKLIWEGVTNDFPLPEKLSLAPRGKTPEEVSLAETILEDYQQVGTVRNFPGRKSKQPGI